MLSWLRRKELYFCKDSDSDILSRSDNSSHRSGGDSAEVSAISMRWKMVLFMPTSLIEDTTAPRHWSQFAMNRLWFLGLIISLHLNGCAAFDTGKPGQASESSARQSEDEGEKNLAAIRALLSEERQRALSPPESEDKRRPQPEAGLWPPDWLASYFMPKRSSVEQSDFTSVYLPPSSASPSKHRTAPSAVTVKIPWVTAPSSRGYEAEPWPPVPTYTVPAPIGSAYPGSIRCVPDMLGGQRCQAD